MELIALPSLDLAPKFFQSPSAIHFRLRYVNRGRVPIEIVKGFFYENHRLLIRDEQGMEPQLTQRGRGDQRAFESGVRPVVPEAFRENMLHRQVVPPGGAEEWGIDTVPGWSYDLAPGRRYTATFEYWERTGTPLRLFSNPVTFVAKPLPEPIVVVPTPAPRLSGVRLELKPLPAAQWSDSRWKANYRLRFTNGSAAPIVHHEIGFWTNHRVVLTDERGAEPSMTAFGKTLRKGVEEMNGSCDHDIQQTVEPGGTFEQGMRIDLERMYDLKPGRYWLTVEYDSEGQDPFRVKSNRIEFVVLARR